MMDWSAVAEYHFLHPTVAFCLLGFPKWGDVGWPQLAAKHPHSLWLIHPQQDGRERTGKAKAGKLMYQGRSLIGEVKRSKTVRSSKPKGGIHSPLPVGRQMFSRFWKAGPQHGWWLLGKTSAITTKVSLILWLNIYCWAQCCVVWNIPLVRWGHLSWLCPVPSSCPPQPTCQWGRSGGKRQNLDTMSALCDR